jgi:hypothetical protein
VGHGEHPPIGLKGLGLGAKDNVLGCDEIFRHVELSGMTTDGETKKILQFFNFPEQA